MHSQQTTMNELKMVGLGRSMHVSLRYKVDPQMSGNHPGNHPFEPETPENTNTMAALMSGSPYEYPYSSVGVTLPQGSIHLHTSTSASVEFLLVTTEYLTA